jgi:hypothetical protein
MSFRYRQEVLGKRVEIEFATQDQHEFFIGTIHKVMMTLDDNDGTIHCSHFVDFDDGDTDWIDLDDAEKAGHLRWPSKQGIRNIAREPRRNHKKRRISCSGHQSHIHPNNSESSKEDFSLDEACDLFSSNFTSDNDPHNSNISGDSPSVCPQQVDQEFSTGNNRFKPSTDTLENPDYALRNVMEAPAMKPPAPADEREGKRGKKKKIYDNDERIRFHSNNVRYEEYTPPASWGALTSCSKQPHTPADDSQKRPIETINDNDVLLGRVGLTSYSNPGNIKFRSLVRKYRMPYCTAPKGDKGAVSRFLCNYVRSNNGRFLRRDESIQKWYEVGDDKAVMKKCGQALRYDNDVIIRKAKRQQLG